jgi:hypothetical protein
MLVQEARPRLLDSADDVDKILAGALIKSTDEYKDGYEDGRNDAINAITTAVRKQADTFFGEMVALAEVFYAILSDTVTPQNIKQYRIGLDYATLTPTVLAVISQECEASLYEIEHKAAKFDLLIFEKYKRPNSFWIITDGDLDQELIERDFPWRKRS